MLYYCKTPEGNLGDDLNPWLWSRLAPEVCDDRISALFVGIGTILSHRVAAEPLKMVFGAGWGGGQRPKIDDKWRFYRVRGPLTAAELKLDPALALTDPAVLVRRVPLPASRKCYPVAFMAHHQSMSKADWPALCARVVFSMASTPVSAWTGCWEKFRPRNCYSPKRCTVRLWLMPCACPGFDTPVRPI